MIANQMLHPRRYGRRVLIPAAEIKSVAARIERQDILLEDGAPITKRELQVVARNSTRTARSATQSQEVPEEGARRLRASAR
jgi:hypothetical protein